MEELDIFLHPQAWETVEGVVSSRFKGKDGVAVQWKFAPVGQEENRALLRQCRKGAQVDYQEYQELLTAASVVYPDLKNAALQKGLGTQGDEAATLRALLPLMGEMGVAIRFACRANGLELDAGEELREAKNASGRA